MNLRDDDQVDRVRRQTLAQRGGEVHLGLDVHPRICGLDRRDQARQPGQCGQFGHADPDMPHQRFLRTHPLDDAVALLKQFLRVVEQFGTLVGEPGAAMRAGLDFLPLGSGLGTLADVFRRYQDSSLVGFIDHAHNDYAEAFVEMGVAGIAVIALFAIAYAARWGSVVRRRESRALGFLQVSAGLSVLALALHGGFDFNFHIPANAIYFSFLAGVFFYEPAG